MDDWMHGKGLLKSYHDGSEYSGDFKKGKREGYGIYIYPGGDRYEGEWLDNIHHGKGKFTRASDGKTTEGMQKHGRKDGEHHVWTSEGKQRILYKEGRILKKVYIMSLEGRGGSPKIKKEKGNSFM